MGERVGLFDKECGFNKSWFDPAASDLGWWDDEIVQAAGPTIVEAVGAAAGIGAASGVGVTITLAVAASVGVGAATGNANAIWRVGGAAAGIGAASGATASIVTAVASTGGGSTLNDTYNESEFVSGVSINDTGITARGQTFTATGGPLAEAKFWLNKSVGATGSIVAKLYALTGTFGTTAVPTGAALATSDSFDVSTLSNSFFTLASLLFSGANQFNLVAGTKYGIVIDGAGTLGGNQVGVGRDDAGSTHAGNSVYQNTGAWTSDGGAFDIIFYVYTGIPAPAGTAIGISNAIWDSVGNAVGVGAALANSGATKGSVGASVGVGAATGLANAIWDSVFNASGVGAGSANSSATWNSVASANGVGAATGLANAIWDGVGNASGVGVATGLSNSVFAGVYNASGTSTVSGDGQAIVSATGSDFFAAGTSTVQAISTTIYAAAGQSDGVGEANGVSGAIAGSVGNAIGLSFVVGVGGTGGVVIEPPPGGAFPYGIEGFYFKGKFYRNKPPHEKEKEKLEDRFPDARRDDKELLEILAMIAPYL